MILFLGATNMIIKSLKIEKLHGIYDYNVKFNNDLTFIYGENGCGKTTILDIVSSIVTGRIYNLYNYKFKEIILSYSENPQSPLNKVQILSVNEINGFYDIRLTNPNMKETIEISRDPAEPYSRNDENYYSYNRHFIDKYEIPRLLRKTFNYIYLPLSRNSQDDIEIPESILYRHRRAPFFEKDLVNKNYLNNSLRYIEEIVRTKYMQISSAENKINTQFRNNILTSSLKVTNEYTFEKFPSAFINKKAWSKITIHRDKYIELLKSIGEWNENTNKRVTEFFDKYHSAIQDIQNTKQLGFHNTIFDLLVLDLEFKRIKEIANQSQKIEEEKEKIRMPITSFLSIVNDFFCIGEDKKHITINNEGKVVVEAAMPSRKLSLYNLSSGEKQIIIIFACLIFGLPTQKEGIYIIDEPEASLHLAWQKIFVKSIQNVNSSIQLIFATHAPEIIGRYSNNAVKLRKEINPSTIEKEDTHNE